MTCPHLESLSSGFCPTCETFVTLRLVTDPKSKWYSTPQAARRRKTVLLTLSDDARARLEWLAERRGESRSVVVEELIMEAKE